jgi:hypothetical protein
MRDQVPTTATTAASIMRRLGFSSGLVEKRAGQPFRECLDDDWSYERGRLFGAIAPLSMPLFVKGRLNPKAVRLFEAASERRWII